jgi:ribose 1,5-bisphosphokinase
MNPRLIYTMGPSGAGKDSLLAWLRTRLPPTAPVHFTRRTITRPVLPDGEQHEAVATPAFHRLLQADAFAMAWEANGLLYGVRRAALLPLSAGDWVLVNGSRAYLPRALALFPGLTVLHITAGVETLRRRLLARGRESGDVAEKRLRRAAQYSLPAETPGQAIEIHNDGTLEDAGETLLQSLRRLEAWPVAAG